MMTDQPILSDELPPWWAEAACAEAEHDLFFPAGDTGDAIRQIEEAKKHCAACPVREECLDFALETNQVYGIWGGVTEQERKTLRRRLLADRRRAALDEERQAS